VLMHKKYWLVLLVVFFLLPLKGHGAEGGLSFRVEESKVRLIIPPGGSQAGSIRVYSQSGDKIKISVYFEDWSYAKTQDGSKTFHSANSTQNSCADWISYSPSEFVLPPYGSQTVNYVTRVPKEATGAHYAVLFFETSFLSQMDDSGVADEIRAGTSLNVRLGSLFYIEAKGTVSRASELTNFFVTKNDSGDLNISFDFKNTGNADITATATYDLINESGLVYARGQFNNVYTFPGDEAKMSGVWKDKVPKGKYDLIITLDLGKVLEEANLGRGPVIVKEAGIDVGDNGEILKVGDLK